MGFSQALSGLNAASSNLDVVGNNIANSQTVGFKGARTQFADVFAGAGAGLGARVSGILQDFSAGNVETTNRNLDLAITGTGFFRFSQNNETVYSRNGQLTLTKDGYLENAQGARLMGFPAGAGVGGQPEELQVPAAAIPAVATTQMDAAFNLDAETAEIDRGTVPFDAADPDTYSYANTGTVFDSQGIAHNITMYFTKTDTATNQWELQATVDGGAVTPAHSLSFDTNGVLDPATSTYGVNFTFAGAGVDPLNFTLDFDGTTQFGNDFSLDNLNQDGYTAGTLVGVEVNEAGNLLGKYSNEVSEVLGTIVLANFRNPEGLNSIGDNVWAETGASGQALLGLAGTGLFGEVAAGALESSNVELTKELVDLIIAQRAYQANTQTIKVQDEVLQSAVNLR